MAMVHIYDNNPSTKWGMDTSISSDANSRTEERIRKPVKTIDELRQTFDDLLSANTQVERLLIETHGSPGRLWIGRGVIDRVKVAAWFAFQGYERMFTSGARILFNGCNIAEGEDGWRFLEQFGSALLRLNGGQITGWTSVGSPNPFNGHVIHLWGDARTVFFGPGGTIVERFEQ